MTVKHNPTLVFTPVAKQPVKGDLQTGLLFTPARQGPGLVITPENGSTAPGGPGVSALASVLPGSGSAQPTAQLRERVSKIYLQGRRGASLALDVNEAVATRVNDKYLQAKRVLDASELKFNFGKRIVSYKANDKAVTKTVEDLEKSSKPEEKEAARLFKEMEVLLAHDAKSTKFINPHRYQEGFKGNLSSPQALDHRPDTGRFKIEQGRFKGNHNKNVIPRTFSELATKHANIDAKKSYIEHMLAKESPEKKQELLKQMMFADLMIHQMREKAKVAYEEKKREYEGVQSQPDHLDFPVKRAAYEEARYAYKNLENADEFAIFWGLVYMPSEGELEGKSPEERENKYVERAEAAREDILKLMKQQGAKGYRFFGKRAELSAEERQWAHEVGGEVIPRGQRLANMRYYQDHESRKDAVFPEFILDAAKRFGGTSANVDADQIKKDSYLKEMHLPASVMDVMPEIISDVQEKVNGANLQGASIQAASQFLQTHKS